MGKIQWLTTWPGRRREHLRGYDCGQMGWKLHAVYARDDEKLPLDRRQAICGLRPGHGWSLDLFIEDKCKRCMKKLKENNDAD